MGDTMSRRITWIQRGIVGVSIGLVLLVACASLVRREDRIKFSHKEHVGAQELACEDCHAAVMESDRIDKSLLPAEAACMECHEKEDDGCGMCHEDAKKPKTWQYDRVESVVFSHKTHLEVTEGSCDPCHKGVADKSAPHEMARPMSHDVCGECHRDDFKDIGCQKCHEDLHENPSRPVSLFNHDASFMERHGTLAKGDQDVCAHCHKPDDCSDCHNRLHIQLPDLRLSEQVGKELVHRGDYLTRHSFDARTDPTSCYRCHTQNQCSTCHEKMNVGQSAAGWDRPSPHPDGWSMDTSSSNFHGDVARRDILSCAACHDKGASSNCVTCHKVGGIAKTSPHGSNWVTTMDRSDAMCQSCH